ncbi:MAG: hypothetical protein KH005_07155 [Clostridium sp.]|nr:hypothetical protein [Clostridium sp.]
MEEEYDIRLPIDEVVFITMFLCNGVYEDEYANRPVLLIAMHGNGTASSISECVNDLLKETIAYSFDLPLNVSPQQGYESLRKTIVEIDKGQGVIVMYDMGSLKVMSEMIAEETKISIELVEMPVTLLALDYARECLMKRDLKEVVSKINAKVVLREEIYKKTTVNDSATKSVITLCMSGQGGAIQMKEYIEEVLYELALMYKEKDINKSIYYAKKLKKSYSKSIYYNKNIQNILELN